jgi:hypothetical protein
MHRYDSQHIHNMRDKYGKNLGHAVSNILSARIAELRSQPTPKNFRLARRIGGNFKVTKLKVGPKHVGVEFDCSYEAWEVLTRSVKHNPGVTPPFNYYCGLDSRVLVESVSYGKKGVLTIPVPSEDFSYLPPDSIARVQDKPIVTMGVNTAFQKVVYDFGDVGRGSILIIAKPGSGKSVLGMNIVYDILSTTRMSQVQIMLLGGGDGPRTDWGKLYTHPSLLTPLIYGMPDDLLPYLTWTCVEMERRFELPDEKHPLLLIVLDEANIALRTPAVLDKLNFIGSQGRKAGVKLVTLAQVRDFGEYAKHFVKNVSTVIAGNLSDNYESTRILGVSGIDTSRLRDKGEFVMWDADSGVPQTFVPIRVLSDDLKTLNKNSPITKLVLPGSDVQYSQFYNFEDDANANINQISKSSALAIVTNEYGDLVGKLVKRVLADEPVSARVIKSTYYVKDNNIAGKLSVLAKKIAKEIG